MGIKPRADVLLDSRGNILVAGLALKALANDVFVEFDITVADTLSILVCYLGHHLSRLVHEVMLNEPLAD